MTIVELRVHMDCAGCEKKIRRALQKLKGVDDVDVDITMQKVTVMGWANQEKVLKTVRKTGRKAELWPYPYNPEYHNFIHHYSHHHYDDHHNQSMIANYETIPYYSSYNYKKHGYSGSDYGYYQQAPYSAIIDKQTSAMFSDENPHACSMM